MTAAEPMAPQQGSAPPPSGRVAAGGRGAETGTAIFTQDHLLLLAAITVLGAVLRLHRVGDWSLWVDEAHTVRDVFASHTEFWSSPVAHYPLSYLLVRALTALGMPSGEGWLRLPFVAFGVMSIPVLGLVGRMLVGRSAALVAALLLALSPWHIYWSQNARSYTMVLFGVLLAAGSFFAGVQRRSSLLLLLALALTIVSGLCHPSAYILLGGFAAYGLLALRMQRRGAPAARQKWLPLLIVLLATVLLLLLLPLIERVQRAKPDFSLLHLLQTLVFFVRTPLLVAAVGGLLLLFDRGDRAAPFLLCWVLVPLLVLAVLAAGVVKVNAQYAFYTLPAFCLLGATVVVALAQPITTRGFRGHLLRIAPAGILLLDMGGHDYLYFQRYHGERPMWRDACDFVRQQPGERKLVLSTNGPSVRYYLRPEDYAGAPASTEVEVVSLADWLLADAGGGARYLERQVVEARAKGLDLWVILSEPELDEMDPGGLADAYLRRWFKPLRWYPNWTGPKDMTVHVYWLPAE